MAARPVAEVCGIGLGIEARQAVDRADVIRQIGLKPADLLERLRHIQQANVRAREEEQRLLDDVRRGAVVVEIAGTNADVHSRGRDPVSAAGERVVLTPLGDVEVPERIGEPSSAGNMPATRDGLQSMVARVRNPSPNCVVWSRFR